MNSDKQIPYTVASNGVPNKNGEKAYHARLITDDSNVKLSDVLDDMKKQTKLTGEQIHSVIRELKQHTINSLSDNKKFEIDDWLIFSNGFKGSSTNPDIELPSSDIELITNVNLNNAEITKKIQASTKLVKTFSKVPKIDGVKGKTENQYTSGRILTLIGSNLKFNENAIDEGVFVTTKQGEQRIEAESTNSKVVMLIPSSFQGQLSLTIRTRYGKGTLRTSEAVELTESSSSPKPKSLTHTTPEKAQRGFFSMFGVGHT